MRIKYLLAIMIATFTGVAWFVVHSVESQHIGWLTPAEQPAPPATQVAARLANSVDSFLHQSSG
jgi:hypothetical protein